MKVIRAKDYEDMSRKAANILAAQVLLKPHSVLGLATGSSPIGVYQELIERCKKGELSFFEAASINLDEYCGLAPEHEQSYRYFMNSHFFDHIDIRVDHTYLPDGPAKDPALETLRYDGVIAASGGIDLQLLGIGHNGHIGFNEPGPAFIKDTHRVELTQSTIEANKRFFESPGDVPRHAYTMGMRPIMQAKRVVLIASGAEKAQIVRDAFFGPITPEVPASILQLHKRFTLVGDEEALALL
ncbi:glucosamine-6-phosphate deaminase [Christensenellaceae bacterium OttesenSCG-928-M15]|nr:glucosamine-6-phosphate deaminase [Christensenellaceae bacterium OttesenSCG-928-M15]